MDNSTTHAQRMQPRDSYQEQQATRLFLLHQYQDQKTSSSSSILQDFTTSKRRQQEQKRQANEKQAVDSPTLGQHHSRQTTRPRPTTSRTLAKYSKQKQKHQELQEPAAPTHLLFLGQHHPRQFLLLKGQRPVVLHPERHLDVRPRDEVLLAGQVGIMDQLAAPGHEPDPRRRLVHLGGDLGADHANVLVRVGQDHRALVLDRRHDLQGLPEVE